MCDQPSALYDVRSVGLAIPWAYPTPPWLLALVCPLESARPPKLARARDAGGLLAYCRKNKCNINCDVVILRQYINIPSMLIYDKKST